VLGKQIVVTSVLQYSWTICISQWRFVSFKCMGKDGAIWYCVLAFVYLTVMMYSMTSQVQEQFYPDTMHVTAENVLQICRDLFVYEAAILLVS